MARPRSDSGTTPDQVWDAIVVGAGPAGATTAGLLAQRGHRVLVLEKEEFPRFHIGESLLPAGIDVLRRLGVEERADTFLCKRGARFVDEQTGHSSRFGFDEAPAGCPPRAWHVDRSRFDTLLRDAAVALGADVRHRETVIDAGADAEAAWVTTRSRTFTGRFLVDASGQSRLLARRADSAVACARFGNGAIFTHFDQLSDAAIAEFEPNNDICILFRSDGWGWVIPLSERRLSVGIVSRDKLTRANLDDGLLQSPMLRRLTAGAQRGATRVVGNYSYRNTQPCGIRFAAVGDAACFLDPVFSSGVTLALRGAELLADRLGPALDQHREDDPDLLSEHRLQMDRAFRTFEELIDRFYNRQSTRTMFLQGGDGMPLRSSVIGVLAGDVWRTGNAFQDMLLGARRGSPTVADPLRRAADDAPPRSDPSPST